MTDTLTLTNRRLLELWKALTTLAQRSLEPISAQRVAILLTTFKPYAEGYDAAVKPLGIEGDEIAAIADDDEKAERAKALNAKLNAVLDAEIAVPKPTVRLTQVDLPKRDKKAVEPSANQAGNAYLQFTLAPELFELTDPDSKPASDDDA